jgi:Na+-driven multidrug efflux pump
MRHLEPFIVLFLLPVTIGIVSGLCLRATKSAALVATLGSVLAVYLCLAIRDPNGTWTWLAAFLVLPLPIAFALAAVLICSGRTHARRQHGRHGH